MFNGYQKKQGQGLSTHLASTHMMPILLCITLMLNMLHVWPAFAQGRETVTAEDEFAFAAVLMEEKLYSYVTYLATRLAQTRPELVSRANVLRAEALVGERRFNEAAAIIKELPAGSPQTDAVRLLLADGYYSVGDMAQCQQLYSEFFDRYGETIPEDPDLLRFYRLAAYKFGQMLLIQGNLEGAVKVYDRLIAATQDEAMLRQVKLEQAELLLRHVRQVELDQEAFDALAKKVQENCNAVIWGGMDLWFGRAVICLADMEALAMREDAAMRLLDSNLAMLKTLDDTLAEADIPMSESPLAGARMILGNLYEREAATLLGDTTIREKRSLYDMGRAFANAEALWTLAKRIHNRDQGIVKRLDGRKDSLRGTATERQVVFAEMDALLKTFEDRLERGDNGTAWNTEVTKTLKELKSRIQAVRDELTSHPREIGITPSVELAFGERFEGQAQMERARRWLEPVDVRREEAIKLRTRALQQFYSIFASYPDSAWSEQAGINVERLKNDLETLTGKTVTIRMAPGSEKKLGLVHISEGHGLFARQQYAAATEAYLKGLALYPEGDEPLVALVALLESYTKLDRPLDVEVTAAYLAERFADIHAAAQGLLRVGRSYFEKNDTVMYVRIYEYFHENFQKHPGAETILFLLGEQRWKEKDYTGANAYYERIVERYPRGARAQDALSRMAWGLYLQRDFAAAGERFKALIERAPSELQKVQARLSYADCLRQQSNFMAALREYHGMTKWLEEKAEALARTEDHNDYRKLHEQSLFFLAYCLTRIDQPTTRVPEYQTMAVKRFREVVDKFPDSDLAPTALSSLGALFITMDDAASAARTYSELSTSYPESDAGRNSRLAMVRSLLDVGQHERARDAVNTMLLKPEDFPPEHFLRIGLLLLEHNQPNEASASLELAVTKLRQAGTIGQEPAMEQRALLGMAKAWLALRRFDKSAEAANDLATRYPLSAFFYEMRFVLAQAYLGLEQTDKATEVLREIFTRASDQTLINKATLALARIQEAAGNHAEALASYQRIVLLADVNDPDVRPLFETALGRSAVLQAETARWQEVMETARQYQERFPQGPEALEVRKALNRAQVNDATMAGGNTE